MLKSINTQQRLYVMRCGGGVSCYGFDVLHDKARAVAQWIPHHAPEALPLPMREKGTRAHYEECQAILSAGAKFAARVKAQCSYELEPALIGLEGKRVECEYFGELIRFKVGKSTGWMPCHLQLHNARSTGGTAILKGHVQHVRVIR